jgi:hypothetical protein
VSGKPVTAKVSVLNCSAEFAPTSSGHCIFLFVMRMFPLMIGIHEKEFCVLVLAFSKSATPNTDFFSKLAEE